MNPIEKGEEQSAYKLPAPASIKVRPIAPEPELESEYAVSPEMPLLSTAIDENGWVCGNNREGQLGVGMLGDVMEPQPLQGTCRWAYLTFGENHSAGISCDGELYTWGITTKGQLGHSDNMSKDYPERLAFPQATDIKFRSVACGSEHTVAVSNEHVYSFGSNDYGQLGHGEICPDPIDRPKIIRALNDKMVTQVVCGKFHTLALTAQSHVYAWGQNYYGQLGLGDRFERRRPTLVESLWALPVRQLAAGDFHSCALTRAGFLFTWGFNQQGQLGLPPDAEHAALQSSGRSSSSKKKYTKKVNEKFLTAMIDMGIQKEKAELALVETKNVGVEMATEWLFSAPDSVIEKHLEEEKTSHNNIGGNNHTNSTSNNNHHNHHHFHNMTSTILLSSGETTNNNNKKDDAFDDKSVLMPKRVPLKSVIYVATGGAHSVAVTQNSVYSWGAYEYGQLGCYPKIEKSDLPTKILFFENKNVIQVACGSNHSVFLTREGDVYGCGLNDSGQLGRVDGDNLHQMNSCYPSPVQLKLPFLPVQSHRSQKKQLLVVRINAGGNGTSFLASTPDEIPDISPPSLWEKLEDSVKRIKECVTSDVAECKTHMVSLINAIEMIFACPAAITATFGYEDRIGLDVEKLNRIQKEILSLCDDKSLNEPNMQLFKSMRDLCVTSIVQVMSKAATELIEDLYSHVKLLGTPERAQVLLAAIQNPLLNEQPIAKSLFPRLCSTILNAPSAAKTLLVKLWSECSAELLSKCVVEPLQSYVTKELMATKKLTVSVMNAIKVLAKVGDANELGRKLPPESFYNQLISEKMDVLDHYIAWRQSHDHPQRKSGQDGPFSFCSYPFLLDARAKSKLLHMEAKLQMEQTIAQSRMETVYGPFKKNRKDNEDSRILPDRKLHIKKEDTDLNCSSNSSNGKKKRQNNNDSNKRNNSNRRVDNTGGSGNGSSNGASASNGGSANTSGFRGLFYNILRSSHNHIEPGTSISSSSATNADHHEQNNSVNGAANAGGPSNNIDFVSLNRASSLQLPSPAESGIPATHSDMCILRIRRNHLMEDALDEIARQQKKDLFKPLRVHFIGEEGIDAGGVKKEFFQLLIQQLLTPDYGMLVYQAESKTYWFNPSSFEHKDNFFLIGLVLGLAVYNGVLLDFPLPMVLYKKLIGQLANLRDLEDMQPTLGKSLRQLLQYEGDESVENVFYQTMSIDVNIFGEIKTHALKPGGEDIMVTEENRREYVDLYLKYVLTDSIKEPFEAFSQGFRTVCGGPAIQLFNAEELERLVCGNPNLDFAALEKNARYDGGFSADSQAVRWLWEIAHEFPLDQKKAFLKFFTGSDRSPIGGLGNLKCIIQRNGTDTRKLPTAHTCFNTLLLPDYKNKEEMCDRLRLAIMNAEGFGLE